MPVTVAPGDVVPFDASGSVPSDSPITSYLWTFGDGDVSALPSVEKVYGEPGAYRAVLRVMDDSNHPCNFGVSTRLVTVPSSASSTHSWLLVYFRLAGISLILKSS